MKRKSKQTMASILKCLFGPRLNRIYRQGQSEGYPYVPNTAERYGDNVISGINVMWNLGWYTSPLIVGWLYRRDMLNFDGAVYITKFFTGVGMVLILAWHLRAFGRAANPVYTEFLADLRAAFKEFTPRNKMIMSRYDFDFHAWPAEFSMKDVETQRSGPFRRLERSTRGRTWFESLRILPCQIISWFFVHSFGIKLVYPGSMSLLQAGISPVLNQGRAKMVEEHHGERFKLVASDNNTIDAMFVDRRATISAKGKTLVISCEGNAGFYEIGVCSTPIEAGYSVLGWNHPGFGGSTGTPFPEQEMNAADVVMQFAIHKLGFLPENIIVHGWSIGGFTASWIAMNYPEVKAVLLDATFDDLMPLAVQRMPASLESIVRTAISEYINLNVADQLIQYPGPIRIVRRSVDEMITTQEGVLSSNRGNNLILKLLKYRYPEVFGADEIMFVKEFMSADSTKQAMFLSKLGINEDMMTGLLLSYISSNSKVYPMSIGKDMDSNTKMKMAVFLVTRYMSDYDSSHCTPLPIDLFIAPWDPTASPQTSPTAEKAGDGVCEKDTCDRSTEGLLPKDEE